MFLIALLLAFIAGVSMAVQGSINTGLGKIIGLLEATFVVHIVGTLTLILALYLFRLGRGDLGKITQAPWYFYLGGVIGVIILYTVVASISRVGVATATTAIIVGQVGTALLIDHFGFFGLERIPFSWLKAVGVALLALGAKFMLLK
ncbi:MAG: DMT family transporter [Bacillota bacterium]|nr:DMT family transporter [Bacillota bacterium]MDW7683066.1 DMT family transporter [Bacillota bacterium]